MKHLNPPARLVLASIFELFALLAVIILDINLHFQQIFVIVLMLIATIIAMFIFVDLNK